MVVVFDGNVYCSVDTAEQADPAAMGPVPGGGT